LVQNLKAVKITDSKAVGFSNLVGVVGRDDASCARHIFHNDRGIPRNMFAHVPRDCPRVGIEPAAGRKTDDDTDRFPFEKSRLRRLHVAEECKRQGGSDYEGNVSVHARSPLHREKAGDDSREYSRRGGLSAKEIYLFYGDEFT
jgi:hypothetical protein